MWTLAFGSLCIIFDFKAQNIRLKIKGSRFKLFKV